MQLTFPANGEKDDLRKANTIAYNCIRQLEKLGAIDWDAPEGVPWEAASLSTCLRTLAALAEHGWGLMPRLTKELCLAAQGVVTVCGVSAANAHEAALRLADQIGSKISVFGNLVPPGDYRGPHVDPECGAIKKVWDALATPAECGPEFRSYKRNWKRRIRHIDRQGLEVLDRLIQREYYVARDRRATRGGKPAGGKEPESEPEKAKPAKPERKWKPTKATLRVIELMKQGLSIDVISQRADVKVSTGAKNLRQIRCRARKAELLPRPEPKKRDTP